MLHPASRASLAPLVLLAAALGSGCSRSAASDLPPDFAGTWDLTFDDSLAVELHLGAQVQQLTLPEQGGVMALGDAGVAGMLEIDCTRPELVCPSEVWPHELTLAQAPGQLRESGLRLQRAIAGQGDGRCATLPGSAISAEVLSVANVSAARQDAVALTDGRISTVHDVRCFAPFAGLPAGAKVVLSTGYTAAKR